MENNDINIENKTHISNRKTLILEDKPCSLGEGENITMIIITMFIIFSN
jgi:hypothetical protein